MMASSGNADLTSISITSCLSSSESLSRSPSLSISKLRGSPSTASRSSMVLSSMVDISDSEEETLVLKQKCTLKERITPPLTERLSEWMDDGEDEVSLGYSDHEDEINGWFNNQWYVPFPLPHNELYANHLHPAALDIASSSCCVNVSYCSVPVAIPLCLATDDNTCIHHSSYAKCARCKGKAKSQSQLNKVNMWMLDSGASIHFIFDLNDFADFCYYSENHPLFTADGVTYITGEGMVIIPLDTRLTLKLTQVALVPNLTNKLISMGALLQDGLESLLVPWISLCIEMISL